MCTKLLSHLTKLNDSSFDIEASALITTEGLIVETTLRHNMATDYLGAICAGAIMLGQHTSDKCASGELEHVIIKCAKNQIVMTYAGTDSILAIITKHDTDLAVIFLELKSFVNSIQTIIATNIMERIKSSRLGRGWVAHAH